MIALPEYAGQSGVRRDRHIVQFRGRLLVAFHMLVERAAMMHIEQLHAAANRQHG